MKIEIQNEDITLLASCQYSNPKDYFLAVVLCRWTRTDKRIEYVTWTYNAQTKGLNGGDYFGDDLEAAKRGYVARCKWYCDANINVDHLLDEEVERMITEDQKKLLDEIKHEVIEALNARSQTGQLRDEADFLVGAMCVMKVVLPKELSFPADWCIGIMRGDTFIYEDD